MFVYNSTMLATKTIILSFYSQQYVHHSLIAVYMIFFLNNSDNLNGMIFSFLNLKIGFKPYNQNQ